MNDYPQIEQHRSRLKQICAESGTPNFICDAEILTDRYEQLTRSLAAHWGPHLVGYSFKTNYLAAESQIFQRQGAWAEVVSRREYEMALRLGYAPSSIIYNGPYKDDYSLRLALDGGSILNVNDDDELERVVALTKPLGRVCEMGIRVTSDLPKLGLSRFGFSMENDEAVSAVRRIAECPTLKLVGLHTHLYGDTDDADLYALAAARLGEFGREHIGIDVKYVDMGGGYPAHSPQPKSRHVWQPQSIDVYVSRMANALSRYFPAGGSRPTLIVEPGRYLTCDGMVLVTRVVHVKQRFGKQQIVCDGSISMVPLTHYCPQIIRLYDSAFQLRETASVPTSVQGATCRENDSLYEGDFMQAQVGDYLIHFAAGAYNSSLSPDFIFTAPGMDVL